MVRHIERQPRLIPRHHTKEHKIQYGNHIIETRLPGLPDLNKISVITDPNDLKAISSDEASHTGESIARLVRLSREAGEAEVAEVLRNSTNVVSIGARTSLTGGATPGEAGATVLDMSYQDKIINEEGNPITVQSGVTLKDLQIALEKRGMYFPPGPTHDGATVGGMISTNAAGAATFKYGQVRPWVDGLTVVLATGEVIDMKRGQYQAHPDGYFDLKGQSIVRRIPIPNYIMPNVPKISAGYYAKQGMDLIDLFIGSEGTLGVITKANLRVIPKPPIVWALVPCKNEKQAINLTRQLRKQSLRTRQKQDAFGIDASAIEYIDLYSMALLRKESKARGIVLPEEAKTLLLVQIEMNQELVDSAYDDLPKALDSDAPNVPLVRFARKLSKMGLLDNTDLALPNDPSTIERFKAIRAAVPDIVNGKIRERKRDVDSGISKTAGDMIVPFRNLRKMLKFFRKRFRKCGLQHATWGHISDGNMHPNILARSGKEVKLGRKILIECGRDVIKLGGSPLAEHGVGRNPMKKKSLKMLYRRKGIEQMQRVKRGFDPEWKLAPGNLFPKAA